MAKVNYPAVFHLENEAYWVEFPDLKGCYSQGDTIEKAYENAKEALSMYLDKNEDTYDRVINKPSNISAVIDKYKNEIVMYIECDSLAYAKKFNNKSVKKTLSIPEWLNDIAISKNINFSNVLQEALINRITK